MTENNKRKETTPDGIVRMCAAIDIPGRRGGTMFLGWNQAENPVMTLDVDDIGKKNLETLKLIGAVDLPDLPSKSINIEPIQFLETLDPIDRKDQGRRKTEDILVFTVKNSQGLTETIHVNELEFLSAVEGQGLIWEDVNPNSIMSVGTTPTLEMYTIFLKDAKSEQSKKAKYFAMMFKPTMKGESNEPAFKRFVREGVSALLTIDSDQDLNDIKGYQDAITRFATGRGVEGGMAYKILASVNDILGPLGLTDIDPNQLENLKIDSQDRSLAEQAALVAREMGAVQSHILRRHRGLDNISMRELTAEDLIKLAIYIKNLVERNF